MDIPSLTLQGLSQIEDVLLSTINWAICKAIDLLELLKIEEEMLSAQSRKTVKGNTLDRHNQSLLPHLHKMCYKGVLKYPGSSSWCNDNPLRREEEDKEDNAEDEEAVLLSTINWAICKAIDLLELLKIEEEMLSAQSRKTVKVIAFFTSQIPLYTAKRQYSRPAQPITFATFAQDVLQGSAQVLLSTINWAICKAIDLLELLKIEEEMLSAQSRKTVKGNTLDRHNQSLLPHLHKMCYKGVLKYPGSSSWCNDNPLRREEEDKEDNAEDEEAVMKARAVDDWKDYNPCGACNQKLTTCD
ncbi:hypothetical protein F2Q69_00053085 [Brassica cretica]|uniref:Uncharacterized protein n=1 Tax=Brassica cretica TaxID=69181 RepID=A0A8S9N7F2_BRACR|nr:hypothetical protein F2Q69_00053085 [Brassica cretica]